MPAVWSRVANTTIKDYLRKREVNVLRNRKLLALLEKKGRVTYNHAGTALDWKIQYKRVPMQGYADGDSMDFARKDRFKTAVLDWRGYNMTDSITKFEKLQNRGTEAIIKIFSETTELMSKDMEDNFGQEIYVNGYLPQNRKRFYGIESFMGANANTGNGVASPTGSFAGLSCVPGNYGGGWNGGTTYGSNANSGWPHGYGDAQFDFWAPIIIDYGDTYFGNSTPNNTWENNCVEAISLAITMSEKNLPSDGMLDLFMIEADLYKDYKEVMRQKERIVVNRDASISPLVALGFKDVINQDGVDVTTEYGVPGALGYGYNLQQMELCSMQEQLFMPEGPDEDIATKSVRFAIDCFGNFKWNPRHFVKLAPLTAS